MKAHYFFVWILVGIVGSIIIFLRMLSWRSIMNGDNNPAASDRTSLIIEPDDGIAPVLAMIKGASRSVDLVMYELQDKQIESALAMDESHGVAVRVLLSLGYKGEKSSSNQAAYNFLASHGVPVRWTQNYFALTHEKSLVADGETALIMTFNFTSQYYSTSRDFGIVDTDHRDVDAMEDTFNDDFEGGGTAKVGGNDGDSGDDLVWSPGSEPTLLSIIKNAKKTLAIYNEEMDDPAVTEALIDAAQRGVAVTIVMTYSSEWNSAFQELTTAGADVRTYAPSAPLYIHAKMMIADGTFAFVGSENFSASSLDDNRELGIVMSDPAVIASLTKTFADDQAGAIKFTN